MIRLLFFAALICFGCKMATGRWPWEYLRATPTRGLALSNARQLLAVPASASRAEVIEAHRRLLILVHPDKGGSAAQVHEADAARDLLLTELISES